MDLEEVLERGCERDWQTIAPGAGTVRFAILGLGWFTRGRALPALGASDYCEPTVLVSSSVEKAREVAANTAGARRAITYEQFHDGEAAGEYDAVYVVTPNALHLDAVETAAGLGKDVLCEKPMEATVERAERLVAACRDAGVTLMVAYRMHTEPAVRRAREVLEAGLVGDPVAVHGSMCQRLLDRVNPDPDQWRLDADLAGGGALYDLGVYPLNTARFLLGADPVAVTGRTRSTHPAFEAVDETAQFTLEFPEEVYASCLASHDAGQSSTIRVAGTEGQVAVEPAFFQDEDRTLYVSRDDGRLAVTLDRVDQMQAEFDYFADRLLGGEPVGPDGEHGLVDVRAMAAVYEADDRDGWVSL